LNIIFLLKQTLAMILFYCVSLIASLATASVNPVNPTNVVPNPPSVRFDETLLHNGKNYTLTNAFQAEMRRGEKPLYDVKLQKDQEYLIVAFDAGGEVLDLDLALYTYFYELIDADVRTDNKGKTEVSFTPTVNQTVWIVPKIRKSSCPITLADSDLQYCVHRLAIGVYKRN
jgi:hypothetical protein